MSKKEKILIITADAGESYENVRFEVEVCGGTFDGKSEAVKDGRYVTGQTWQSHPDFYRMVFECLND